MIVTGHLQWSHDLGLSSIRRRYELQSTSLIRAKLHLVYARPLLHSLNSSSVRVTSSVCKSINSFPRSNYSFRCHALLPDPLSGFDAVKAVPAHLIRIYKMFEGGDLVFRLVPTIGIVIFVIWGLKLFSSQFRVSLLNKYDETTTYEFIASFLQPFLLWVGATYICRVVDPILLPSETSQAIKIRVLNFVRSSSTVLACAYCVSGLIQQAQKLMVSNDPGDARNIAFQFAGKATYTAVWIAAALLFMELLGFSTQKLLTAGGLGTVLLTLVGREIFTNFLSSVMIHATRPFVVNEWIQTKIEGYEVSGFVERVGWWSPTIIRGEDQEALYIPNYKFTVNVVRNLSQKTHWRIKTHLAVSHLDANKINSIVADMRKVLSKHPQVEQKRLHRRVFLENINPENQGLMILISCFVKTSHFDEYLGVKEAVLMDLLRVISHHRARLATPIRTMQKFYSDSELENLSFGNSIYNRGVAIQRPLLLTEPLYRAKGEDKSKPQASPERGSKVQDTKTINGMTPDRKSDSNSNGLPNSEAKMETIDDGDAPALNVNDESSASRRSAKGANPSGTSVNELKPVASSSDNGSPAKEETAYARQRRDGSTGDEDAKEKPSASSVGPNTGDSGSPNGVPHPKQKAENKVSISDAALEGNLVLGLALDGSKRTLSIDDGLLDGTPLESNGGSATSCVQNHVKNKSDETPSSVKHSGEH